MRQALPADDREQLALLECLTRVIPVLGVGFQAYAAPVFQRCIATAQLQLQLQAAPAGAAGAEYEPEFLVCALDVVSSLVEGLGTSAESLAEAAQLRELVFVACADESPDVRQSGFALLGDLAKACPSHLLPVLRRCLEACCATLATDALVQRYARAATNACWAVGELALRAPAEEVEACTLPLLQCMAGVLVMRLAVSKGTLENAGITLGRLALRCPAPMVPHLGSFAAPWCVALRRVRDSAEKEQAFAGLCALVAQNPMAVMPAFTELCNALASWRKLSDEALHRKMSEVLRGYQAHLPAEEWARAWGALEPAVQDKLRQWFLS